MISTILLSALLIAQTNTTGRTTGHDRGNMEHRENSANNDTVPANATAREAAGPKNERVWNDATRIAGLLHDMQVDVPVSAVMWRTIANEANVLANRLYARTSRSAEARRAATSLRKHVREMRAAALIGDAAAARKHAGEALPFAYRLIDWSA